MTRKLGGAFVLASRTTASTAPCSANSAASTALKKRLTARLGELDTKEEQYLDLVGEPGWPKAKIQKKLAAIATERAEIEGQLAETTTKLDAGKTFFLTALELLSDPQAFYRRVAQA